MLGPTGEEILADSLIELGTQPSGGEGKPANIQNLQCASSRPRGALHKGSSAIGIAARGREGCHPGIPRDGRFGAPPRADGRKNRCDGRASGDQEGSPITTPPIQTAARVQSNSLARHSPEFIGCRDEIEGEVPPYHSAREWNGY